ncbi:MAG TPA: hypothetical protein VE441_03490 [Mycobacterium sp.]|nr:hypothetical protein [Mycobacterium sp.]
MGADEPRARARRSWSNQDWFDWLCGLVLPAVVYAPPVAIALLPSRYELRWQWSSGGHVDFSVLLAFLPGIALVALVAPLVLYRRRDALLVPLWPWSVPGVEVRRPAVCAVAVRPSPATQGHGRHHAAGQSVVATW